MGLNKVGNSYNIQRISITFKTQSIFYPHIISSSKFYAILRASHLFFLWKHLLTPLLQNQNMQEIETLLDACFGSAWYEKHFIIVNYCVTMTSQLNSTLHTYSLMEYHIQHMVRNIWGPVSAVQPQPNDAMQNYSISGPGYRTIRFFDIVYCRYTQKVLPFRILHWTIKITI